MPCRKRRRNILYQTQEPGGDWVNLCLPLLSLLFSGRMESHKREYVQLIEIIFPILNFSSPEYGLLICLAFHSAYTALFSVSLLGFLAYDFSQYLCSCPPPHLCKACTFIHANSWEHISLRNLSASSSVLMYQTSFPRSQLAGPLDSMILICDTDLLTLP